MEMPIWQFSLVQTNEADKLVKIDDFFKENKTLTHFYNTEKKKEQKVSMWTVRWFDSDPDAL